MNTEPEGPLDLWKSAPVPPAVPTAPSDRHPLQARPTPPPAPVAEPRNLYPHPQPPVPPQYAQPVAGPQYPPQYAPPYPPQPTAYPLMNVVQNNVGYGGPVVRRAFPHGLHLVLSLITCGLWLPIWLIHYLVAGNR